MSSEKKVEKIELKRVSRDEKTSNVYLSFLVKIADAEKTEKVTLCVSEETFKEYGLSRGEIKRETFGQLKKESQRFEAYRKGLLILSYGANSKKTLEAKLKRGGFCENSIEYAIDQLEARGYINESENALGVVKSELRKLSGERRIYEKLRQKGYFPPYSEELVREIEETDFAKNCAKLIEKKYKSFPSDRKEAEKAVAALIRTGYTLPQIKTAITLLK